MKYLTIQAKPLFPVEQLDPGKSADFSIWCTRKCFTAKTSTKMLSYGSPHFPCPHQYSLALEKSQLYLNLIFSFWGYWNRRNLGGFTTKFPWGKHRTQSNIVRNRMLILKSKAETQSAPVCHSLESNSYRARFVRKWYKFTSQLNREIAFCQFYFFPGEYFFNIQIFFP